MTNMPEEIWVEDKVCASMIADEDYTPPGTKYIRGDIVDSLHENIQSQHLTNKAILKKLNHVKNALLDPTVSRGAIHMYLIGGLDD